MRSSLLLLLMLLPAAAGAQTLTLGFGGTSPNVTGNVLTSGGGSCDEPITITWSVTTNVCSPGLTIYVVNSDVSCSATVPTSGVLRKNLGESVVNSAPLPSGATTGHADSLDTTLSEIYAAVAPPARPGGQTCGSADPQTRSFRVCGVTKFIDALGVCNTNTADVISTPDNLQVVYDTEPPAAPALTVRAQDGKLVVTIPSSDEIALARVEYRRESDADFTPAGEKNPVQSFEITGLENGARYFVRASQTDVAGNVSPLSAEVEATPTEVKDFRESYLDAGGKEQGGCGAAGGAGLSAGAALAVLGLWLASRRRA